VRVDGEAQTDSAGRKALWDLQQGDRDRCGNEQEGSAGEVAWVVGPTARVNTVSMCIGRAITAPGTDARPRGYGQPLLFGGLFLTFFAAVDRHEGADCGLGFRLGFSGLLGPRTNCGRYGFNLSMHAQYCKDPNESINIQDLQEGDTSMGWMMKVVW